MLVWGVAASCLGPQTHWGRSHRPLLESLERPGRFETRRTSSADRNWRNGNHDAQVVLPGKTITLADLEGPGRITHMWFTVSAEDKFYPRSLTLRIYWDGEASPSVEAPLGDFFAVGHGLEANVNSIPVVVTAEGRSRHCYWPMPFRKSARVTLTNDSPDKRVNALYWQVDWQKLPSLPADTLYFHAQYRQEFPARSGRDYLIFDGEGDGLYVGTVLSVQFDDAGWFGEGDDRFYIDGAAEPQLRGTGTEDYIGDAWGFRPSLNPFYGVTVWEGTLPDDRCTAYRWHIADPVRFRKSLRVTVEHKGFVLASNTELKTPFGERPDYYSSVAFWYQRGAAKRFFEMPQAEERIVHGVTVEAESESCLKRLSCSPAEFEVAKDPSYSGGAMLLFTPPDGKAWVEMPFHIPEDGRYVVKVGLLRRWDCGVYELRLDGRKMKWINLFSPWPGVRPENLGSLDLARGEHRLRLVCLGRDPGSRITETTEPGYHAGVDWIYYRKLAPRK